MYIHEFRVRNFSIHKETHLAPSPITVLVGPNGSGKSGLFDALLNFSMLSRGSIAQAFGPYPYSYRATKYRGASSVSRIGFDVLMSTRRDADDKLRYNIDYSQTERADSHAEFQIHSERLQSEKHGVLFDREDPDSSPLASVLPHMRKDTGILAAIRRAEGVSPGGHYPAGVSDCAREISRFNRFRLEPQNLGVPSDLPDLSSREVPKIEHEGRNLASTLYYLQETDHPCLGRIKDRLRTVIPAFEDFEFNSVGAQRIGFSVRFSDQRQTIPAPRLSDGQRLLIGLMTLLGGSNRIPILMLEEPENGLTATAQRAFYQAVRDLASRDPIEDRSQVLISSHSPFIVCEAWNGEDREFIHQVKVEGGRAVVRPFSEAIAAQGIHLSKGPDGSRTGLSLKNAEEIMSGYLV